MNNKDFIGIFDSGIGGLTVASAIHRLLPNENLIYFGDTVHLPYGDKSPDAIRYYSIRISKFLQSHSCKMIVIACNSASAVAYNTLKDFFEDNLFVNAVDPLVQTVIENAYQNIGIIGTSATIDSATYKNKIATLNPSITTHSIATPLLVPLIEKELQNIDLTKRVLESYLSQFPLKNLNALLLACTHYPLIKDLVEDLIPSHIDVLDSANPTAALVKDLLTARELLNPESDSTNQFYLSDITERFQSTAEQFFGGQLSIEKKNFWS